jgi:RHS repeat-associated protein
LSRTVSAGSQGQGSSTTSYWYGGALHPLVVTRDGVTYRLIGKDVVEQINADAVTRFYLDADHLGSVRMVTDDQGSVTQSLGYDDDYGSTRIAGQAYASSDDAMASFYRFQGQEQEVFPLATLGIDNNALAQWLDQLQLYHFPWRDYAAGLASFTQTDPIPTQDSLYSAFAANPVNFTDETGGMLGDETGGMLGIEVYNLAHLNVPPRLQVLLDHLRSDPSRNFPLDQVREIEQLELRVVLQRYNSHNPYPPSRVPPLLMEPDESQQAFIRLHREQDEWLDTYAGLIGQLRDRTNARLGVNLFGEPIREED